MPGGLSEHACICLCEGLIVNSEHSPISVWGLLGRQLCDGVKMRTGLETGSRAGGAYMCEPGPGEGRMCLKDHSDWGI